MSLKLLDKKTTKCSTNVSNNNRYNSLYNFKLNIPNNKIINSYNGNNFSITFYKSVDVLGRKIYVVYYLMLINYL